MGGAETAVPETTSTASMSRRGIFGLAGVAAATVGGGALLERPAVAAPVGADDPTSADLVGKADDPAFWRRVRRLFTLDKNSVFMNVGTVGSPPRETLRAYDETNRRVAREAFASYESFDGVRAHIAEAFGCDQDEIAISGNTSDGMAKALAGLKLGPGDEIVTTNHEHSGGKGPMAIARDRLGVVIKEVKVPVGDKQRAEDYVELFSRAITARTKVMLFSAPTYKTGTMLPIRMLAELAQDHGITTVVDAANVPGMFAANFHEYGVDLLSGAAAKWQCGPAGTGILYVRNKVLPRYNPNPLPEFWPQISSSYPYEGGLPPRGTGDQAAYDMGAYVTELGNGSLAGATALDSALTVWDRIGRKRIENYILGLSRRTTERVVERWGDRSLYSPYTDRRLGTAFTTFNPFQDPTDVTDEKKSDRLVDRVRDEYGYTVRNTDFEVIGAAKPHYPIRISTHLFHDESDVDGVVDALWKASMALR